MKKFFAPLALLLALFALTAPAAAQTAAHVRYGSALPSACNPATGDVFIKTSVSPTESYWCSATNTWTKHGASGDAPGGGASGDLSGTYPGPTVAKLQGRDVASTAPTDGQALVWSNSNTRWQPGTVSGGGGAPSGSASGDLSGTYPGPTVAKIKGRTVGVLAPPPSSFADDFDDNSINASLWSQVYGTLALEQNQRLELPAGTSGLQGATSYNLSGKATWARLIQRSGDVYLTWTYTSGGSSYAVHFNVSSSGNMQALHFNATAGTFAIFSNLGAWSSTTHAFIRLRHSSTSWFWDTAPDAGGGVPGTWTQRATVTDASTPSAVTVQLRAVSSSSTTAFDNFNSDVAAADPVPSGSALAWDSANSQWAGWPINSIAVVTSDPSGAPTLGTGMTVAVFNVTNNKLWIWNTSTSTWKSVTLS